jgi:hypothetical protein
MCSYSFRNESGIANVIKADKVSDVLKYLQNAL